MFKIKIVVQFVLCILLTAFSITALAENWHYSIIVNAGSSGSRLHLLRYHFDSNKPAIGLPTIEDMPITPNKTNITLASFEQNPAAVVSALDSLFNAARTVLITQGVDPATVPVYLFGTAGMRMLAEDEQKTIYTAISEHLKKEKLFALVTARTITGDEEGIYDWLDVNYFENHFTNSSNTVGIIDVGGASVEIVFATQNTQKNQPRLTINGQEYTLYSKSILGLGLDQARKNINNDPSAATCYPTGYSSSSPTNNNLNYFIFNVCRTLNSNVLNIALPSSVKSIITAQQKFVAFGGAFYAFNFFIPEQPLSQITRVLDQKTFENNINAICTRSWQTLKEQYPADSYLANECANGIYIDELLFGKSGFLLQDSQLQVTNTINQQPIDWTLGALLYQIINY